MTQRVIFEEVWIAVTLTEVCYGRVTQGLQSG
jgi:hypothetical protein